MTLTKEQFADSMTALFIRSRNEQKKRICTQPSTEAIANIEKCQYPNIAAEVHWHGYGHSTFADHGEITLDLLEAFLNGEEMITDSEIYHMFSYGAQEHQSLSRRYLYSPRLGYYNLRKKKHYRKVYVALRLCELQGTPAHAQPYQKKLFLRFPKANEIFLYPYIPRALVNAVISFTRSMKECEKSLIPHRGRRIKK